ncbi:unnamed protein product [Clavelina lepadiformis]|uniref:Uncharacterized protein n=1 Tax=Clavelina lepadiformis TaxID=159417 RepID=A0ABP0GED0_CLALP
MKMSIKNHLTFFNTKLIFLFLIGCGIIALGFIYHYIARITEPLTALKQVSAFEEFLYLTQYKCQATFKKQVSDILLPNICQEKDFWPYGRNAKYNECLVYSFLTESDFNVEKILGRYGCEVHVFNPKIVAGESRKNSLQ